MLKCRQDGFDKVNKKYGTNITVELNSSWESNAESILNPEDEGTTDPKEGGTEDDGRVQDTK